MTKVATVWPGIALTLTFLDDVAAGPVLALLAATLGPQVGVPLAVVGFTIVLAALVASAHAAARHIEPGLRARIDALVASARRRPVVGRAITRIGDRHPVETAIVAIAVSPVLAVLLARSVHPLQRGARTVAVAVAAYGVMFSLTYALGGSAIGALL